MADPISYTPDDLDILTRTLLGEARGEGVIGMRGVGWVARNRTLHSAYFGVGISGVLLKRAQFSCWNQGDPNRAVIMRLASTSPLYVDARQIAADVLNGAVDDPTNGADSYYAITSHAPYWAATAVRTRLIGHHQFCRVLLGLGHGNAPNVRHMPTQSADALNAAELSTIEDQK